MNSEFSTHHAMDPRVLVAKQNDLPHFQNVLENIRVKEEMDEERKHNAPKISPQPSPPELPHLVLPSAHEEKVCKALKVKPKINKKTGSRGGGIKASKEGQERRAAILEKTLFHRDPDGEKVYHFNIASYNYKTMAIIKDVPGVQMRVDPQYFVPPCGKCNVEHYRFKEENKSKRDVEIPNMIIIPPDMYEFMYFRFLENTDRDSKTRRLITAGPSEDPEEWHDAWKKAKKNLAKKWVMLGIHRAPELDNEEGEVWVMTRDGWNKNAYTCQSGSRNAIRRNASDGAANADGEEQVYKAVGQIVIEDDSE